MNTRDFDELAGRVEGVAQALLYLSAELEMKGFIDGPRLSRAWRKAQPPNVLPVMETARVTLCELAQALDGARAQRQAQGRQRGSRRGRARACRACACPQSTDATQKCIAVVNS